MERGIRFISWHGLFSSVVVREHRPWLGLVGFVGLTLGNPGSKLPTPSRAKYQGALRCRRVDTDRICPASIEISRYLISDGLRHSGSLPRSIGAVRSNNKYRLCSTVASTKSVSQSDTMHSTLACPLFMESRSPGVHRAVYSINNSLLCQSLTPKHHVYCVKPFLWSRPKVPWVGDSATKPGSSCPGIASRYANVRARRVFREISRLLGKTRRLPGPLPPWTGRC